ncbi:hypothetical protein WDY66_00560 [Dermacoccus nishinomiyaensis]|uniref:hypothetical protein n=1 Tax=Dermacoccus TaxID=57495 RepID=UPI000784FE60|nr:MULTISPECIES: hypothetical protein [unclassified Dermacoccus]TCJ90470.1 hypothetical protein EDC82_0180 [Dermacoccus sp. SAI-028]
MIWLAAQLWPAALLALVAGFAITWFTVVRRLDDAPVSAERERRDGGSRRAGRSSGGHSDAGRAGAGLAGAGRSDAAGSRRDDPSDGLDDGEPVNCERHVASRVDGEERDEARPDVPAHRTSGSVGSAFTSRRDE